MAFSSKKRRRSSIMSSPALNAMKLSQKCTPFDLLCAKYSLIVRNWSMDREKKKRGRMLHSDLVRLIIREYLFHHFNFHEMAQNVRHPYSERIEWHAIGFNRDGMLGTHTANTSIVILSKVDWSDRFGHSIKQLVAMKNKIIILTSNGAIYSMGSNFHNMLSSDRDQRHIIFPSINADLIRNQIKIDLISYGHNSEHLIYFKLNPNHIIDRVFASGLTDMGQIGCTPIDFNLIEREIQAQKMEEEMKETLERERVEKERRSMMNHKTDHLNLNAFSGGTMASESSDDSSLGMDFDPSPRQDGDREPIKIGLSRLSGRFSSTDSDENGAVPSSSSNGNGSMEIDSHQINLLLDSLDDNPGDLERGDSGDSGDRADFSPATMFKEDDDERKGAAESSYLSVQSLDMMNGDTPERDRGVSDASDASSRSSDGGNSGQVGFFMFSPNWAIPDTFEDNGGDNEDPMGNLESPMSPIDLGSPSDPSLDDEDDLKTPDKAMHILLSPSIDESNQLFEQAAVISSQMNQKEPSERQLVRDGVPFEIVVPEISLPRFKTAIHTVVTGLWHSCWLTTLKQLYACGSNDHGQCGFNPRSFNRVLAPKRLEMFVGSSIEIVSVTCGDFTTYALDSSGSLWSFGANSRFELGHGHCRPTFGLPFQIKFFTDLKIKIHAVYASTRYALVITDKNYVYMWGQFGDVTTKSPALVFNDRGMPIIKASLSETHALILDVWGHVYGIGSNIYGQASFRQDASNFGNEQLYEFQRVESVSSLESGTVLNVFACGEASLVSLINRD